MILWWLAMLYLGGVAFVLLRPYVQQFSGQGYAITKIVGLVGFGYILWLLASLSLAPFAWLTAVIVALIGGLLALRILLKSGLADVPWKTIGVYEAIFAATLVIWSFVRSYNPRIEGVEKFMDIALLQGLMRTDYLPPLDPWFAGETTNYYYFGHFLIASLAKLTNTPGEVAFNIGLALVFALCILATAAIVYTLTKSRLAAGISALLLTLSSNLDPALNTIQQNADYIFFGATRLDPYTINEFPLYSFTVADLHAHTLGLPLALGIIAILYVLLKSERSMWPVELALIILLGATGPTNSFDLVIYGGLTGLVFLAQVYRRYGLENSRAIAGALGRTIGIGVLAGLLYLPFYLDFQAPVGGIGIALFQTPLWFLLVNFGVMLYASLPIVFERIKSLRPPDAARPSISTEDWFAYALGATAILLVIATEFVYLIDIYTYQNEPFARANTIFKVYYQVWVLLAIVAGYGIAKAKDLRLRYRLMDGYVLGVGGLIAVSLIGTYSALEAYADSQPADEPSWTLNGFEYLKVRQPDQLAMIEWMNQNIEGQPTVLEAAGESYTQDSRISSYTGLPTIIGWASHQWGWRYSRDAWQETISPRVAAVESIYQERDPDELKRNLAEWDIEYVVVSPIERQKYDFVNFTTLEDIAGEPVFEQGAYRLYKLD